MKLSEPDLRGEMSLEEALSRRRSRRRFQKQPLTPEQVSQLLWAAQGITEPERAFRTAPSAGATFPLELYPVMAEGVFHYKPEGHEMEKVISGDMRLLLSRAAIKQRFIEEAPLTIIIASVQPRTAARYGPRAERYIYFEVGHAAQNIHLQAVSLGLGSVPVGAFHDDEVQRVTAIPAGQAPLYLISVGYIIQQ